ncbi:MAG: carboxypeptidase-like regulatory domain-containing protein [bacterium]|jgi:hypothetical protein|nr:carboxypeptidase-like regulatory domain-containing protein [bacterium]
MRIIYTILFAAFFTSFVCAQGLLIEDFEGVSDDGQLQDMWAFSKASGPDGIAYYLDTDGAPQGNKYITLDVAMEEKWWYNTITKQIDGGPIALGDYFTVDFMFKGSDESTQLQVMVCFFDSQNRAIRYVLPNEKVQTPTWQRLSVSLDSFEEEEWDDGHGTETPNCDRNDIVGFGLRCVGQEHQQFAFYAFDDIRLTTKPDNLQVDGFESYADETDLAATWSSTAASGGSLWTTIDTENNPPEGNQCLLFAFDMPLKWYEYVFQKTLDPSPMSLSNYKGVEFWFHGDANLAPQQSWFIFTLRDSQNRGIRFLLPNEYLVTGSWQKVTLSFDSFEEEEWDAGRGTAEPDCNRNDVTTIQLKSMGDADAQSGTFYIDDIQFISQSATSTINGTVTDGATPVSGVTVLAISQSETKTFTTATDGTYSFELEQGKNYRILPYKSGLVFAPGAVTVALFDQPVARNFTATPTVYDDLDTTTITDPFDASGVNPAIGYRGSREWYDEAAGDTRPVIDVTQDKTYTVNFPDSTLYEATLYSIEPNTLAGATSPNYAVEIGSNYSWDMLAFGQDTNSNYYVEADVYCDVRFDLPENSFDRLSVAVHCSFFNPDTPSLDALGQVDQNGSSGGYALSFETDKGEIVARKYAPNNDQAHARYRLDGFATEYGRLSLNDESGWHRFRVEYLDGKVTFSVNGTILAETTDTQYPMGPGGLHYRACVTDAPDQLQLINHGRFDNLKAGPTKASSVADWMLN